MYRTLLLLSLTLLAGCKTRPFEVMAHGCMAMSGDMKMDGKMAMSGDLTTRIRQDNQASRLSFVLVEGNCGSPSKIAIVEVDGLMINKNLAGLGSMGENPVALFCEKLQAIEAEPSIAAVVLRINTPGGGVTASDIMCHELSTLKSKKGIPVVACIMDVGAGGGYFLATYADAIVAHPTSLVGGIGVLLNTYNLEDTLGQFNIASVPIKSGSRIDVPSPERTLAKDDKEMLQGMADSFHTRFMNQVSSSRPRLVKKKDVFDGRVMTGSDAKAFELIDHIGYMDDAIRLASEMSVGKSSTSVVMLRRDNDRAYTTLDMTPNAPWQTSLIPIKMPGLDRTSLPTFNYLWQPDPSYLTASGG